MELTTVWASVRRYLRWETLNDLAECALSLAEGDFGPADLILHLSQFCAESWEVLRQGHILIPMAYVRATAGAYLDQPQGLQLTDCCGCGVPGDAVLGLKLSDRLQLVAWCVDALLDLALQLVGNHAAPA